jgi:hypothetical protein
VLASKPIKARLDNGIMWPTIEISLPDAGTAVASRPMDCNGGALLKERWQECKLRLAQRKGTVLAIARKLAVRERWRIRLFGPPATARRPRRR